MGMAALNVNYAALAGNLSSARNVLIATMGDLMTTAQGQALSFPT